MPDKKTNVSAEQPSVVPSAPKVLAPEEVSRQLGALAAFLRTETAAEDAAGNIDAAAQLARIHIAPEVSASAVDASEETKLPAWALKTPEVKKLFIEEERELELWKAVAEPISKSSTDVLVNYERSYDRLSPGGTEHEQGIALPMTDRQFSIDEWKILVKPILDRYVKALELRFLTRFGKIEKEKQAQKIRKLLPQVFHAQEFTKSDKVDVMSEDFRDQVQEMVNEINTNPQVLKAWIQEQLEEEKPAVIASKKIDKGENQRSPYGKSHKSAALSRIKKGMKRQPVEDTSENALDELADKISRLGEQLLLLNTKHREGIYKVPKVKKDYVETPSFQDLLEEFAQRAVRQLELKKGMISLIGDMGTGKNYLVEHFAAQTHRPYFYFPCSRGMDAADLGFHFEFRKGESITVPSNLARGLRTKNAVILIDEPNSLPPEVVAALHGLADHNRSFVYNGVEFKAAEGVVIVMAMNPATYSHVKSLPEAISDRTLGQDMVMDYPPLTKLDQLAQKNLWNKDEKEKALQDDNSLDKEFICDEALIVKDAFPDLRSWESSDFMKLWEVVVNGKGEGMLGEKAALLSQVKSSVEAVFRILKMCDLWRKKYKSGDMQRTISLRGATAVALQFQKTHDIRKAFLSLYKPGSFKYDGGREDYDLLETMLNDAGELEKPLE